jgi:cation transport regulator ChaB
MAGAYGVRARVFGGSQEGSSTGKEVPPMPATDKDGEPREEELPSTLQRSDEKAQRTFAKTHDSAVEQYGEGERAHRVAFAALKHTHEKVGDHWEPKDHKGPSDPQAEGGVDTDRETAGGVDANASKKHLQDVARRLDVKGRSSMTKDELVEAIGKANDRATAAARRKSSD